MRHTIAILIAMLVPAAAWANAETISGTLYDFGGISTFQNSDGRVSTIYDFGTIKQYQDSRGTTGTIYDFGDITTYRFNAPRTNPVPPTLTEPLWQGDSRTPDNSSPWRSPPPGRR